MNPAGHDYCVTFSSKNFLEHDLNSALDAYLEPQDQVPLFVDLDGTLIKTDMLVEGALSLLKNAPWLVFAMLYWLLSSGRSGLKAQIASRAEVDAGSIPLQREFVAFLHSEAESGRKIYLATASDERPALAIANRLGIFSGVLASTAGRNLKSRMKLDAIRVATDQGPFDYAGNAHADMSIWAVARKALVVNPDPGVLAAARARFEVDRVFDDRPPLLRTWLRAIRIHQWLKNLLLFVPLLTAHAFNQHAFFAVSLGFLAFGLVASGTYILNDLLDLVSDRMHPRKSSRPFAAGNIGLGLGVLVMGALVAAGLAMAAMVSPLFVIVMLGYFVVTLSYSLYFKTYVLINVLLLASLYTMRIVAGAFAINVTVSSWLLLFSTFVFLSLALVKRCAELEVMREQTKLATSGRDYRVADRVVLGAMGVAAGYLSVLILALYVDDPAVRVHYSHPHALAALCPFMLYWISRVWIKTSRGEMNDDPLLYSLQDRASWIVFVAMGLITLIAI